MLSAKRTEAKRTKVENVKQKLTGAEDWLKAKQINCYSNGESSTVTKN